MLFHRAAQRIRTISQPDVNDADFTKLLSDTVIHTYALPVPSDANAWIHQVVAEARNEQEALEFAILTRPDIVILDYSMPVAVSEGGSLDAYAGNRKREAGLPASLRSALKR